MHQDFPSLTRHESLQEMLTHSRGILRPQYAKTLTGAWGVPPLRAIPNRVGNSPAVSLRIKGVACYQVAQHILTTVLGQAVRSDMPGAGSFAGDITEKAVRLLQEYGKD
jgi:hypothetical protein